MQEKIAIFDRDLYKLKRQRASKNFAEHDFLFKETAATIKERFDDITQEFESALIYGPFDEDLGTKKNTKSDIIGEGAYDEEVLPFEPNSFDLIVSNLSLHFINDLPGALIQYMHALKKNGMFIATAFAGETLKELRQACANVDMKNGGLAPRIAPFIDIRDGAGLLQRAGFYMPVADLETITVHYSSLDKLLKDIKGMGQSNCLVQRSQKYPGRDYFKEVEEEYSRLFAEDGNLVATFDILTFTGSKN